MELTCPECGRVFSVPENTTQRLYKCLCKFTFSVDQGKQGTRDAKPAAKEISLEDKYLSSESLLSEDSQSSISEDDLNRFLTNLKETKMAEPVVGSEAPPPIIAPREFKIEVDEEKIIKKKPPPPPALDDESTIEMPERQKELQEVRRRVSESARKSQLHYTPSFLERLQEERSLQIKIGVSSLIAIGTIVGIVYWANIEPPPPPDPYLQELLQKKSETSPAKNGTERTEKTPEKPVAPQRTPTASPQKLAAKPTPKAIPTKREALVDQMMAGHFSKVGESVNRLAQLSITDRSFAIEAACLSENESLKARALLALKSEKLEAGLLNRATAVCALIESSTRTDGINRLKSLQLTRPQDAWVSAYLGLGWKFARRPVEAVDAWNQALTRNPRMAWVEMEKEETSRVNGKYDWAIESADRLSQLPGFEGEGYYRKARLLVTLERSKEATSLYEKSLKFRESLDTRLDLAQLYIDQSKGKEAWKHAEFVINQKPSTRQRRDGYLLLGKSACQLKQFKEARHFFNESFKTDSNFIRALEGRAECESESKDFKRAAQTYQSILKRQPRNALAWALYGRNLRLADRSNPKAALAAQQRSLEISESDLAHYELALVYRALNRKAEAKRHAQKALQLNPKNLEAQRLFQQL